LTCLKPSAWKFEQFGISRLCQSRGEWVKKKTSNKKPTSIVKAMFAAAI